METSKQKNFLFSQGGSGTEYTLMNFNWDEGLYARHQRIVNFRNTSDRFVYILNNPIDILKSFHRRGFLNIKAAVLNLQGDVSFKPPMSLDDIADQQIDYFHFENHFNNFYNKKNKGLFIKYQDLKSGWDEIEKFTGLKRKTEFVWKPKKSDLLVYSEKTINELNKLYSEWIKNYNSLPNIFTNEKN